MNAKKNSPAAPATSPVPLPILVVFRGIGQVFFQENALTGAIFTLGIALSSPKMAVAGVIGSIIGSGLAYLMGFDSSEVNAGIYGFNSTLVGIATVFFFPLNPGVVCLMLAGCAVAGVLTRVMRGHVPFPTYTTPFIVTTWGVYFLAKGMGAVADPGAQPIVPNIATEFHVEAALQGVSQVMFQESIWTGLLFLIGIAVSNARHAALVLVGAVVGMLVAIYHFTLGADTIDPERLIQRTAFDVVRIGLYGYNATLAPVALYLWRKSLVAPLLGMMLTVPFTELVPTLGLPALTAPFVLATWLVLLLGWLEGKLLSNSKSS